MTPRYHSVRATAQRDYDLAIASHRQTELSAFKSFRDGLISEAQGEALIALSDAALTVARNAKIEAEKLYPTKDETRRRDERLEAHRRGWRD